MKSLILQSLESSSKSAEIFQGLLAPLEYAGTPHEFVSSIMNAFYALEEKHDRGVHGRIFEYAIGESLAQEGILPLYYQAQLRHVPLAIFDWLLYDPKRPIAISCKTKSRDRWKQAAYEAMALKRVYSRSTNYLITIEPLSAQDDKEEEGDIDYFLIATEKAFSDEIKKIAKRQFEEAEDLPPILNPKLVHKN